MIDWTADFFWDIILENQATIISSFYGAGEEPPLELVDDGEGMYQHIVQLAFWLNTLVGGVYYVQKEREPLVIVKRLALRRRVACASEKFVDDVR